MMKAFGFAKAALESMYDSTMTVRTFDKEAQREQSVIVRQQDNSLKILHEDIPCRISKKDTGAVDGNGHIMYSVILFCSNDFEIPAGSRIEIKDSFGRVTEYVRSGEPFDSYTSHQEVVIQRDDTV